MSRPNPIQVEALAAVVRVASRTLVGPIDLAVRRGELLAVVGPNGAGKTTLLRLLTGLLKPTEGEVRLAGEPLDRLPDRDRARAIAYVPQVRPAAVPLTIRQLVLLGRYPFLRRWQRTPSADDFAAVDAALARVGLTALADRWLERLSGGERQAAYVAAALAPGAETLVLDEPGTHLDPAHQHDLAELLRSLHGDGRTIVVATHDLAFAAALADRVLVLGGGRRTALESTADLMRAERLAELFGAPFEVETVAGRPAPRLAFERSARAEEGR